MYDNLLNSAQKLIAGRIRSNPVSWLAAISILLFSGLTGCKKEDAGTSPHREGIEYLIQLPAEAATFQRDAKLSLHEKNEPESRQEEYFYNSLNDMLLALHSGKIDAMEVPQCTAEYLLKREPGLVIQPGEVTASFYMAMMPEDKALREEINVILTGLARDGILKSLIEKWINQFNPVNLSNPEMPHSRMHR